MAKKNGPKVDRTSLRTVDVLLNEMDAKIASCEEKIEHDWTLAGVQKTTRDIYELARALKAKMPENDAKATARALSKHAFYLRKYAAEENLAYVETNLTSLRIDLGNLKENVARLRESEGGLPASISEDLAAIKNDEVRSYLDESIECLAAGAYRASIVMTGCSLESLIRSIYVQAKGGDSSRLSFARVLDTLQDDKDLQANQTAIVNICRVFRNLTGHPTGYTCGQPEAESILRLAITQLKKNEETR